MRAMALAGIVGLAGLASAQPEAVRAQEQTSGSAVATAPAHDRDRWIFPGEYESHEAMWMLWPTYENKAGFPSTEVVSDLIAAMRTTSRSISPSRTATTRPPPGSSS